MSNTITIEAGDIVDFTFKIQQAILDGYRLSDQGDFAPQCIGFVYVATMEKAAPVSVGYLEMIVNVDTEQALAEIAKIAQEIDCSNLPPEQQDKVVEAVKGNITVEQKQPRQTRGRK